MGEAISLQDCFVKDPFIISRDIGGECLLVPIRQNIADLGGIYLLNEVGRRIWELLDGQRQVKDIISVISSEYAVNAQEAEADVLEFLHQVREIGAIAAA
jgi:hypothetical protein